MRRSVTRLRPAQRTAPGAGVQLKLPAALLLVGATALGCTRALAEEKPSFPQDQIAAGAELYADNCSPCHGPHMLGTESAFNLRKFPPDQRERFITSVTR